MRAASTGNEPVVRLLLDARAQMDLGDREGNTALILAELHSRTPIVWLLHEAGADKDVRNKRGQTARMVGKSPACEGPTYRWAFLRSPTCRLVLKPFVRT